MARKRALNQQGRSIATLLTFLLLGLFSSAKSWLFISLFRTIKKKQILVLNNWQYSGVQTIQHKAALIVCKIPLLARRTRPKGRPSAARDDRVSLSCIQPRPLPELCLQVQQNLSNTRLSNTRTSTTRSLPQLCLQVVSAALYCIFRRIICYDVCTPVYNTELIDNLARCFALTSARFCARARAVVSREMHLVR